MLLRLGKRHTAAATKPALRHTLSCLLVPNAPLWGAAGAGAARTGPLQAILQQPAGRALPRPRGSVLPSARNPLYYMGR